MTASPITSSAIASPVRSINAAARIVDLGRLAPLTSPMKRVGNLLRTIALAPVWPLGVFVEVQALLGLPIRTLIEDQDFLYEPDPFAAESPFQRDVWPF